MKRKRKNGKKKSNFWIILLIVVILLVVGLVCLRIFAGGGEDSWIKDSRGVYVKHGEPALVPDYVQVQQIAIGCAEDLYEKTRAVHIMINSQCLGTCGAYAVDVVHVPRTDDDELPENQCAAFRSGELKHFVELDKNGTLVRIG